MTTTKKQNPDYFPNSPESQQALNEELQTANLEITTAKEFAENLLETANTMIVTLNTKAEILTFNKFAQELTGYKREEVIGKNWFDLFIPETEKDSISKIFADALKKIPQASHHQNKILTRKKEERIIDWNNTVIKDNSGKTNGILSIGRDITENIKSEKAVLKNEQKFRTLMHQSPLAIQIYNLDGFMIHANEAWQKLWKIDDIDKVLGHFNLLKDQQLIKMGLIKEFKKVFDGEQIDLQNVRFDPAVAGYSGRVRFIDIRAHPLINPDGSIQNVVVYNEDVTETRMTEIKLTESEAKYRRLTENAKDMIYRMSLPDGKYEYVNTAARQITGYSPEEFYADPRIIYKTIHPDWKDYLNKQWQNFLNGTVLDNYEYQIIHRSGEEKWVHQRNTEVKSPQGEIIAIEGIVTDITKSKQNEKEQQEQLLFLENLKRINQILSQSGDLEKMMNDVLEEILLIFNCDRSWLLYPCDPKADSWSVPFEKTKPEYPGTSKTKIKMPMTPDVSEFMEELLTTNEPIFGTLDLEKPDYDTNDDFNIKSYNITVIRPKIGKPWQFGLHQCSHHRIWNAGEQKLFKTISQRIEEALNNFLYFQKLSRSEKKYKNIIQTTPDLLYRTDTEGKIVFASPSVLRLSGYTEEEYIGMKVEEVYVDPKRREVFLSQLKQEGYVENFEAELKRKDGSIWYVSTNAQYLKDKDNNIVGVEGISRDITERIKSEKIKNDLEKQLRHSHKIETIGTLAGGIAHDFNNILAPIMGYADMAMATMPPENPLWQDLDNILKGANRARDLVKQILLFSRQIDKEQTAFDLHLIIREALKLLRPSIPSTIEIRQLIDPSCSQIMADASQIHQVIVNLCTNAWQSMEKRGGTLTIELKQTKIDRLMAKLLPNLKEAEYIRLTVQDTGTGMDASTKEHIFEPFFTTKAVDKGTGLGLSVAYGIIRNHQGDILVESKKGKGSIFHVFLPIISEETIMAKTETEKIQSGDEYILVVDDDATIAKMIKAMLERIGYQADAYSNSISALSRFRKNPNKYDLVISDLTMPHLTGLQLSEQIQKIRPGMPLIIMTGYGDNLTSPIQQKLGIKKVLSKPIMMKDISKGIREILDK